MSNRSRRRIGCALLAALALTAVAPRARAGMSGERVVSGDASFQHEGNVTTIRASDGAILQYDQLSVWANEELHFIQPDSSSRVLNRVLGDATHIDGGLFANGIVYIVNPAGIFFGGSAVVDVAGLVAAAGSISNEDFLAHVDQFTLSGPVANAGRIEGTAIALLGTEAANYGSLHAPDGTIALVAGEKVVLTQLGAHLAVIVEGAAGGTGRAAIEQTGVVDAEGGAVSFTTGDVASLAINHEGITRGGEIELRAASGTVQVAGELDASDRSAGGVGGAIVVTGERVALLGAELDASGGAGGGSIRVGGDLRGEGELPTARRTYVDDQSTLRADALASGDGGRVIVWSDEATAFHGEISARGGEAGGDGGFAEISGASLWAEGDVDLSASSGANGTLLYDPKDIVIAGGPGDGDDDPDSGPDQVVGPSLGQILFGTPDELTTPFEVFESELEGTAANIELEATNSITSTGTFDGAVRITDGFSLAMRTRNDAGDDDDTAIDPGIDLSDVSFETGGAGSITLETGTGTGTGMRADIAVANLTTAGGAVRATTEDGAIAVGDVVTAGAAGSAGGAISLLAGDANRSGTSHVTAGVLDSSGGVGAAGAGGSGGAVTVRSTGAVVTIPGTPSTNVTRGGGSITVAQVDASGGDGATTGGAGGAVVITTTDGAITATGTIDTSGGSGATGGNAGLISIDTRDANEDGLNDVTVEDLVATGGNSSAGAGGRGGTVAVNARQSLRITNATDPDDNQEPAGGGQIETADIDTSGGDSTAGNGGSGGNLTVAAENGDVTVGAVHTRGGSGANATDTGLGGNGAQVFLTAGSAADSTGDLVFETIDAREGFGDSDDPTPANDGGPVALRAGDDIEHTGEPGPQIRTGGNVTLTAGGDIGAQEELQIAGGDEDPDQLRVTAGGTADVAVVNPGFRDLISAVATDPDAAIEVTQAGGDAIRMAGSGGSMVVSEADGTGNDVNLIVGFENHDEDADDGTLVLADGSVRSAGAFRARSDGDIVIGSGGGDPAIEATLGEDSAVTLFADDDRDGSGAIRDVAGDTGVIDLDGGFLTMSASEGIGAAGDPIVTRGGGSLSAVNAPRDEDGTSDPGGDTGIFVRNTVDGDLAIVAGELAGVRVDSGSGDIEIANDAGGIDVRSVLRAKPLLTTDGPGGDIELSVAPGSRISLEVPLFSAAGIGSGGTQTYDGDVVLAGETEVESGGDIEILGGLDASDDATGPVSFTVTLGDEATDSTALTVQDGIGAQRALGSFALNAPTGASIELDTGSVSTSGGQSYGANLELAQTAALNAGGAIDFAGDVTSAGGLTVATPAQVRFTGTGDQSVEVADDLLLNPAGRPLVPADATIAKASGNLSLASSGGDVRIGDGEKLSVVGQLALAGDTVRFTDLSALDIQVTSPDAQVFARAPGSVLAPGGGLLADGGTDLIGTTVAFSSAPTVVGSGPPPRIATASGTATNAGPLRVAPLPRPITSADFFSGGRLLDLAISTSDPGHETPELWGGAVEAPLPGFSDDHAAPAEPVSAEEVTAYLACAPLADEEAPAGCAAIAEPGYGSALDTERAQEVARGYRALLDDSERARAGREAVARAAADPNASLAHATSPEGRAYLADLARVLGQVHMMGLGPARYAEVKADVLEAVASAIGLPDTARLAAAVDASAMGMPI